MSKAYCRRSKSWPIRSSHFAGLANSGDLVLYAQTGAGSGGNYTWTFTNLAQTHLGPQGQSMPALVGDIMANRAEANGWAGLVLHGAIRDSVAIADVRVGVQALGTIPRKSGKAGRGAVDVPVSFGGVTFTPGDILHADQDGVVLLPTG